MESWRGLGQELGIKAEDAADGSGGRGSGGWVRGTAVLAGDAVGAGSAEEAVKDDVG